MKWLVLWTLWAARLIPQRTPPLRVTSGWLRGVVSPTGTHAAYLNIPYATITHRFQAPGPEPVWDRVFDAENENVRCPQDIQIGFGIVIGQQNCLVLNVYTPLDVAPGELLPVMFFIHGGGFFEGSASPALLGPEYLVRKKVLLVTINYRLGIEGFLCLKIKEAPGNAGLKDQVAALKWVQRNVKTFGGDPDNVTIFGVSAGGASVSYQVLSPMSKGLFHKAIMQSGSSLASWAFQHDPVHVATLKAQQFGFYSKNPRDILNYIQSIPQSDLIANMLPREKGNVILSQLVFVPCREKYIEGVEPFLTEMPHEALSKGKFNKVPMIIGATEQEGLYFAHLEKDDYLPRINFHKSLPKNLHFPTDEARKNVGDRVKSLYLRYSDVLSVETLHNLSMYVGDAFFNYPAVAETTLVAAHNVKPVYSYLFTYNGWRNVLKWITRKELRKIPGAGHADDMFYMFNQYLLPSMFEHDAIDKMATLWTNFAKWGDPNPSPYELLPVKWPEVSKSKESLVIDQAFTTTPLLGSQRLVFWDRIYSKYRRQL